MIQKSIIIHNSNEIPKSITQIDAGSHQQLLREYVELLNSQLSTDDTKKLIQDTVSELISDFNNGMTYTHHIFEHCKAIAGESELLNKVLTEFLKHKDTLYANLHDVLQCYQSKYHHTLPINIDYLSFDNISDFKKMIHEGLKIEFEVEHKENTLDYDTLMYIKKHLGVIPTIRIVSDTQLNQFLDELSDIEIHELKYYMASLNNESIHHLNHIFTKAQTQSYFEHNICSIHDLLVWASSDNASLNYLYDHAKDYDKPIIIKTLLKLDRIIESPKHLYDLPNGIETILNIYTHSLQKGDFNTTKNVIKLLDDYLNQKARRSDKTHLFVSKKLIDDLDLTIMQYNRILDIDNNIVLRILNHDDIKIYL